MRGHTYRQHNAATLLREQEDLVSYREFRIDKMEAELISRIGSAAYKAWYAETISGVFDQREVIKRMTSKLEDLYARDACKDEIPS